MLPNRTINDGDIQDDESQDSKSIDTLIIKYKNNLESHHTSLSTPLSELVVNFIEVINTLLTSITTAGATQETILKDLICVTNIIANPTSENIVRLYDRFNTHVDATSIRNQLGIPSAVGGTGMVIASGILFFAATAPVSTPILIGTAAVGVIMGASGTGVVVDAKRKRRTVAECEEDILSFILHTFIVNKNYVEYACAKLSIFKYDAQNRGTNDKRDFTINKAIEIIANENSIENIILCLSDLKDNLIGINSRSKVAGDVENLIKIFKIIKEEVDKIPSQNQASSSLSMNTSK